MRTKDDGCAWVSGNRSSQLLLLYFAAAEKILFMPRRPSFRTVPCHSAPINKYYETDSAVISLTDLFFNDPLRDGYKQDSSLASSALQSSSLSFHTSYFCCHPVFPLPPITTCLPLLPPSSPFPPSPPLQWIGLGSGPFGQWSKWQLWQGPDFTLAPSVTCLAAGLILIM